tara:strand:+ start:780 stop:1085 length:306 start_codon:yes stop_codon:yes gene_type:complete
MARFSKSHFETVATVLRTNLAQLKYDLKYNGDEDSELDEIYATATARNAMYSVAVDFHNVFRLDNPRYDADKFMDACGMDDWRDMTQVEDWDLQPYKVRQG